MANGFGGNYYGGDSLFRHQLRNALLSKLQNAGRRAQPSTDAGGGMGFTVRPTETMSSTLPTAQEDHAFNERVRDRALYGSYGHGGLEREKMSSSLLAEAARQNLSTKERAEILQKNRDLEIMAANSEFPVGGGAAYNAELQKILNGDPIGQVPAKQEVPFRDIARSRLTGLPSGGRLTVPAGTPNAGAYDVPGKYVPVSGSSLRDIARNRAEAARKAQYPETVRQPAPGLAPRGVSIEDALDEVLKNLTLQSSHGGFR